MQNESSNAARKLASREKSSSTLLNKSPVLNKPPNKLHGVYRESTVTILQLPTTNRIDLSTAGPKQRPAAVPAYVPTPCYVAGPENQLVLSVISKLMEAIPSGLQLPEEIRRWAPLALVGPPGCGKSHLAKALANQFTQHHGEENILFLTAVDFRRRFDQAVRENEVEAFRQTVRGVSLLVMEDLQRLPRGEHLQDELLATFVAVQQAGGMIITTLSKPPSSIDSFQRRMLSRFAEGLTLEVSALSEEARGELLKHTLLSAGTRVEEAAVECLTQSLSGDARRVIQTAEALSRRYGKKKPIGMGQAEAFLADQPRPETPPLRHIATVIGKYYSLPLRELKSSSRKKSVVLARSVAIYLARELTPMSYLEIGRFFGGRDHTTIMHNYKRIEKELKTDRSLRSAIEELSRKFASG